MLLRRIDSRCPLPWQTDDERKQAENAGRRRLVNEHVLRKRGNFRRLELPRAGSVERPVTTPPPQPQPQPPARLPDRPASVGGPQVSPDYRISPSKNPNFHPFTEAAERWVQRYTPQRHGTPSRPANPNHRPAVLLRQQCLGPVAPRGPHRPCPRLARLQGEFADAGRGQIPV